jgi:SAM-dependent methyltransferase
MLRIAITKNRNLDARFLRQEFHNLRLPEPVDLITCNFDSLNYLLSEKDLLQALQRFHANLAPRGILIFDMITRRQPWQGNRPLLERRTWPGGGFRRRIHLDPRTGLQTSDVEIRLNGRAFRERHRQRAYPWHVIQRLLRRAGFRLLETRDFYTWKEIDRRTRRITFVAQKP